MEKVNKYDQTEDQSTNQSTDKPWILLYALIVSVKAKAL